MKRFILAVLICIGLYYTGRAYYKLTDDFRMGNITHQLSHNPNWEVPQLTDTEQVALENIFNQEFKYLDKGAQCYVFASEDDKYVIKFFKFKHLKPSFFVYFLPITSEYRQNAISKKNRRLHNVFTGHKLAYEYYKKQSGMIYLHLNLTDNINKTLKVKDKLGITRYIDLDKTVFLVQEKAIKVKDVMKDILRKGQLKLAKHRFRQIIDLYIQQYEQGIYDWGRGVMHNNGFVGEKPIHFDIEKIVKDERMKSPEYYIRNLNLLTKKIDIWLCRNYPQYREEILNDIQDKINEI